MAILCRIAHPAQWMRDGTRNDWTPTDWHIPAGVIAVRSPAKDGPEAVSRIDMNAHLLVFECPNCGRPMPFIRLDEGIRYPNLEQEVERVDLACLGADCGWKGTLQLEQRVRVEPSNGPTSNLRVPTRTQPQGSPTNPGDIKGRVRDTYDTASHRLSRATNALRGEEDSQILGKAVALAIGVGIGVGIAC